MNKVTFPGKLSLFYMTSSATFGSITLDTFETTAIDISKDTYFLDF